MLFRVVNLLLFLFVALALSLFNEKFIKFEQVWFQAVFPVNRHKIRQKHKIYIYILRCSMHIYNLLYTKYIIQKVNHHEAHAI